MIYYAIRDVHTQRYFVHTDGNGNPCWSSEPVTFKTMKAIEDNLVRLCSEFFLKRDEKFKWSRYKAWHNFNPNKLHNYEIITLELCPIGSINAGDGIDISKLTKLDIKKRN